MDEARIAYSKQKLFFETLGCYSDAIIAGLRGGDGDVFVPVIADEIGSNEVTLLSQETINGEPFELKYHLQSVISFRRALANGDCGGGVQTAIGVNNTVYVIPNGECELANIVPIEDWLRKVIGFENLKVIVSDSYADRILSFPEHYSLESERIYSVGFSGQPGEKLILTAGPSISSREAFYSHDAALNGWNSKWSHYLDRFEKTFAEFVGSKYAISTSSCTGALQIALMALDIGPGDEVIVPDQTWVATAKAVRYVGATPIFADIELDSWGLDAKSVEVKISANTKAIMPVHMYGNPARMDALRTLADKHGLYIVEDAAPAIGATWQNKVCGTFGEFGCFSFQGAKLLVTGEGGMLVTDNEDLYIKAKKIWDQGRNPSKVFWIDDEGVKFKMSNVQAAIGLGQIERANELIAMKRRIFSWYEEGLSGVEGISLNKEVEGAKGIYWMSSIRLDENLKITRDELIKELKDRNVDTRPVFPAISQYPIWDKPQSEMPVASLVGRQSINLPSGVCLHRDEVSYICKQIREIIET